MKKVILDERNELRGMAGYMLVGALKMSVVGGLRHMSVAGKALMENGGLVSAMMGYVIKFCRT